MLSPYEMCQLCVQLLVWICLLAIKKNIQIPFECISHLVTSINKRKERKNHFKSPHLVLCLSLCRLEIRWNVFIFTFCVRERNRDSHIDCVRYLFYIFNDNWEYLAWYILVVQSQAHFKIAGNQNQQTAMVFFLSLRKLQKEMFNDPQPCFFFVFDMAYTWVRGSMSQFPYLMPSKRKKKYCLYQLYANLGNKKNVTHNHKPWLLNNNIQKPNKK